MNVDTVERAKATVDAMPLMRDGLATYQYVPVGLVAPLGRLIQAA